MFFDHSRYTCYYGFSQHFWTWLKPLKYGIFGLLPNFAVVFSTILLLDEAKKVATAAHLALRWQGIMTVVLTAIVYSFFFLPISIYQIVEAFFDDATAETKIFSPYSYRLTISFVDFNVLANFFIYFLTVSRFREFVSQKLRQTVMLLLCY